MVVFHILHYMYIVAIYVDTGLLWGYHWQS